MALLASFSRIIRIPERIEAEETFEYNLGDHIARYMWVLDKLAGKKTLDCGCGEGYGTDWLNKMGVDIIGIDCSPKAIKRTRPPSSREKKFVLGEITRIPFRPNSFDTIISFEVIEHLENGTAYVSQICRLLKDNGIFIGSTPIRKQKRYKNGKPKNPFHKKEYYLEEIKDLLEKHFEEVDFMAQRFPPKIVVPVLAQLHKLKVLRNQVAFYPLCDEVNPKDEKCLFIAHKGIKSSKILR